MRGKKIAKSPRADKAAKPALRSREELKAELERLYGELFLVRQDQEAASKWQAELEISREHYANLYDFAPVGYATLSLSGRIYAINIPGAQLLGRSRDDLTNSFLLPLLAKDDRGTWLHELNALRAKGQSQIALKLSAKNDINPVLRFYLKIRSLGEAGAKRKLKKGSKEVQRVIHAAFVDISVEAQAEAAVQKSAARFRLLVEQATEGMSVIDEHGIIHYQSPNIGPTLGYQTSDMEDRSLFDFVHVDDRMALRELLAAARLNLPEPKYRDIRMNSRDGSVTWLRITPKNLLDHPFMRGIVLNSRDVTEQRKAEAALAEAARKKDEFLAMLAHELRNPMAAISTALSVLSLPNIQEDKTTYAKNVLKQRVMQLSRLVDDLLDVSRIERGKIGLQKENLDIAVPLESALGATAELYKERRHELIVNIAAELPVFGDRIRLEQIFSNLLTNAGKYTNPGGRIYLSARREGKSAVVSIKDNGIGIQKDYLPKIFELFGQADSSFHRSSGGLGIGLTIVKRLVEMHGGAVNAESDGEGKGSEFIVRLPIDQTLRPAKKEEAPPASTRPLHILVAEDHKDTAFMMEAMLKEQGHLVEVALDGEQALEAQRREHFDVLLLDLGLPKKDGLEVAREVRRINNHHPLIVAVTGYGQERDIKRSREAGIDYHLLKPLDQQKLARIFAQARQS